MADHDPLAAARGRGPAAISQWIKDAGGILSATEVAGRLDMTTQAVTGLRTRGAILAVPTEDGGWAYPACQIDEHALVPGLTRFLDALEDEVHPWTRLAILLTPSREAGGQTRLELLRDGRLVDAQRIAATWGQQG